MTSPQPGMAVPNTLASSAWCIIGGGNMANAIVRGAVATGRIAPDRFVVVESDETKRAAFESAGVKAVESVPAAGEILNVIEASKGLGHFILAVKPQVFPQVGVALRTLIDAVPRRVASIMAGLDSTRIESTLGPSARVIRLMPNTPAQIQRGTTAWTRGSSARLGDEAETVALFGTLGETVPLEERLFDAYTAVAGSGPAYLFYLAEAMVLAATREGIDAAISDRIVRSVLAGASELLRAQAEVSPAELRSQVTSKGGTTEAAIRVLEDSQVKSAIDRAIAAATSRGRTLSGNPPGN